MKLLAFLLALGMASAAFAQPVIIPMSPSNINAGSGLAKSTTGNSITLSSTGSSGNFVTYNVSGTGSIATSGSGNFGGNLTVAGSTLFSGSYLLFSNSGSFVESSGGIVGDGYILGPTFSSRASGVQMFANGTSGNLLPGILCLSSSAVFGTGNYVTQAVLGTNLSYVGTNTSTGGTLNVGTATFGTGAYSATSTLVPYTGATGGVNLGSNFLNTSGTLGGGNFALAGTGTLGASGSSNTATTVVVNGALGFTAATQVLSASTGSINWNNSAKQKVTLWNTGGTSSIAFTAPTSGQTSLQLIIVQGSTASSVITFTGATIKWQGGTAYTPTNSAGAIDVISFLYDGTNYYGVPSTGFAGHWYDGGVKYACLFGILPVAFVLRRRRAAMLAVLLLYCQPSMAATNTFGFATSSAVQQGVIISNTYTSGPFLAASSGTVTQGLFWPGTSFATKRYQMALYVSSGTVLANASLVALSTSQSSSATATQSAVNALAMGGTVVSGSYYWPAFLSQSTAGVSQYYTLNQTGGSVCRWITGGTFGASNAFDTTPGSLALTLAGSASSWAVQYTVGGGTSATKNSLFFGTVRNELPRPPHISLLPDLAGQPAWTERRRWRVKDGW